MDQDREATSNVSESRNSSSDHSDDHPIQKLEEPEISNHTSENKEVHQEHDQAQAEAAVPQASDEISNHSSEEQHQEHQHDQAQAETAGDNVNAATDISALWEAVLDDDDFLAEDLDEPIPASNSESAPGSLSSSITERWNQLSGPRRGFAKLRCSSNVLVRPCACVTDDTRQCWALPTKSTTN
jgi:hypothetical protein